MTIRIACARSLVVFVVGAMVSLGFAPIAMASQDEADGVRASLEAAGVDTDSLPEDLIERVNERTDEMIEAGVVSEEAFERIVELRDSGELDARIAERIDHKREERKDHRETLVDRLAEAGVDVGEGQSVRAALSEAGYDKAAAKDLMKSLRPDRGDDDVSESDEVDKVIDSALKREKRSGGGENRGRDEEAKERNEREKDGPREGLGPRDENSEDESEGDAGSEEHDHGEEEGTEADFTEGSD